MNARKRAIFACMVGNFLEVYDYSIFAFLIPVISLVFLPNANPQLQLFYSYAIFITSHVIRPFASVVLSNLADRYGRRNILLYSLILMIVATGLTGLLPVFKYSVLLLILLRMTQGISMGGEFVLSTVYIVEQADERSKYQEGNYAYASGALGILFSTIVTFLMHQYFTQAQLVDWAWRLPFLLAATLGIVGVYLRYSLLESHEYSIALKNQTLSKKPLHDAWKLSRFDLLTVFVVTGLCSVSFAIVFYYLPSHFVMINHINPANTYLIFSICIVTYIFAMQFFAKLSDHSENSRCMFYAALGLLLFSYPLFVMILMPNIAVSSIALLGFCLLIAAFNGPLPGYIAQLFPTSYRASALAPSYNAALAVYTGLTSLVTVYLVLILGSQTIIGLYIAFCALMAFTALSYKQNNIQYKEKLS